MAKVLVLNSPWYRRHDSRRNCDRFVRQGHGEYIGENEFQFKESFVCSIKRRDAREDSDRSEFNVNIYGKPQITRTRPKAIRSSPTPEDLHWRESVLLRDGYKCTWCGSDRKLQADHIKPKLLFPHLRHDIDNGRTLCFNCHKQTETYGRKVHRLMDIKVESV